MMKLNATVVVLLLAAAVFASTMAVPGVWKIATAGLGIILAGIGLGLAVLRAQQV